MTLSDQITEAFNDATFAAIFGDKRPGPTGAKIATVQKATVRKYRTVQKIQIKCPHTQT